MSEEQNENDKPSADQAAEKRKTKKNPIDKVIVLVTDHSNARRVDYNSVAAELDVGLDIEAKYYDPVDACMALDDYEALTVEDLQKMIELHRQVNKKKLVLRITKYNVKMSFLDESVDDIEIPHSEIPRIWTVNHRGKRVLAISRCINNKYRMYFIQLEKSKGELFYQKLQISYKEALVVGGQAPGDDQKDAKETAPLEKNVEIGTEAIVDESTNGKEKTEKTAAPSEIVGTKSPEDTASANLLDFTIQSESKAPEEITFESLLESTPAASASAPPVSDKSKEILDLFSVNATQTSSVSNAGWANFGPSPVQETVKPVATLGAFPAPTLAPPPGRVSPKPAAIPRPTPSPLQTPSTPTLPFGNLTIGNGNQNQATAPSMVGLFPSSNAFSVPQFPTQPRAVSPAAAFPSDSTNPFAATTSPTPAASVFGTNSLDMAFGDLRQPQPTLMPQTADSLNVDDIFNVASEPQHQSAEPAMKFMSVWDRTTFGDLLDQYNFKSETAQLATPKDMFAAKQAKEKGPSLNDMIKN